MILEYKSITLLISFSEVLISVLETNNFSFRYEADPKIKTENWQGPMSHMKPFPLFKSDNLARQWLVITEYQLF